MKTKFGVGPKPTYVFCTKSVSSFALKFFSLFLLDACDTRMDDQNLRNNCVSFGLVGYGYGNDTLNIDK